MNSYFSLSYLWVFLPVLMIIYKLTRQKNRWIVLLSASFLFYWIFSGELVVFLLFSILSIHHCGLWMAAIQAEKSQVLSTAVKEEKKTIKVLYQRKMKRVMLLGVLSNLAILLVLKYTVFFDTNLNILLQKMHIGFRFTIPEYVLPLGISFYTLEAISYLVDIYRGTISADRNLGRVALYMCFFPAIMEGPICRYSETAQQLWEGRPITYRNMTRGFQRILFGVLKKTVVADHLAATVHMIDQKAIWAGQIGGASVALLMICYTCQLYMEFSGTLDIVLGSAEIFGIQLPENFQHPFFSRTISEFWKRWHITLGTWFRDYIFYPVSVSKTVKRRLSGFKARFGPRPAAVMSGALALLCVWSCNGLWHGDDWKYIFFGLYHFVLILTGVILEPFVQKYAARWHINRECYVYKFFQRIRTFFLVCIGELIFWAKDLPTGFSMVRVLLSPWKRIGFTSEYMSAIKLEPRKIMVLSAAILLVFVISVLQEKKTDVREWIADQNIAVRWILYYAILFFIIIFGAFGPGYIPVDPIYAQF